VKEKEFPMSDKDPKNNSGCILSWEHCQWEGEITLALWMLMAKCLMYDREMCTYIVYIYYEYFIYSTFFKRRYCWQKLNWNWSAFLYPVNVIANTINTYTQQYLSDKSVIAKPTVFFGTVF
jgi:hypothetical protein